MGRMLAWTVTAPKWKCKAPVCGSTVNVTAGADGKVAAMSATTAGGLALGFGFSRTKAVGVDIVAFQEGAMDSSQSRSFRNRGWGSW